MITYNDLHIQNHNITELSNVLLQLFKDRSMCDTGTCCELFHRYMDKVREHIDLVDKNLYSKLLTHDEREVQELARNFMSGSHEIRKIMSNYVKTWCPRQAKGTLDIADHDQFVKDSMDMFELVLVRIQNETEKLYPLVRELNDDKEHVT